MNGHSVSECKKKLDEEKAKVAIKQENSNDKKVKLAFTNRDNGEVQFKYFDKKVSFLQDVKPLEEKNRKKCNVDSESFFTFTKDTWATDIGASSHIKTDDSGLENVEIINDPIHGTMSIMITMKKGKK